jgi:hypothetical protein
MAESFRERRERILNESDEERAARLAAQRPSVEAKPIRKRRLTQAARKRVETGGASHHWRDEQTKRSDLARRNHICAVIDSACSSAAFDPQAVRTLTTRENFADACDVLTKAIEWPAGQHEPPHALIWLRQNDLLAFRLAIAFDIPEFTSWGTTTERVTPDWLRERAPSCEPSRVCLALMGECDWPNAGPRERAGLILHHVVEARRS